MKKKDCKWLLALTFWCLSAVLFAQQKPSKQQQAELDKAVKEAEAEMMVKARDLQFEQAAKLRDEVKRLKEALLMQQV